MSILAVICVVAVNKHLKLLKLEQSSQWLAICKGLNTGAVQNWNCITDSALAGASPGFFFKRKMQMDLLKAAGQVVTCMLIVMIALFFTLQFH
ncbi:hypothetical protein A3N47_09795 [Enterobacter hormaechei subsp. xiangfangensis]|nr:hypothetical protein A3N47_09795 [Enterobacter hormaechei subsp. xiangfangensis]